MKKRVFIDMDGVLCEYRTDATFEDMLESGYFKDLRPQNAMICAVKNLIKSDEYEVFIVSSVIPECRNGSVADKNDWLDRYLPEIDKSHRYFPLCGTNKADCVGKIGKQDILCDDYSENLNKWVASGGMGIKILNGINGKGQKFQSGIRVKVKCDSDLLSAVCDTYCKAG